MAIPLWKPFQIGNLKKAINKVKAVQKSNDYLDSLFVHDLLRSMMIVVFISTCSQPYPELGDILLCLPAVLLNLPAVLLNLPAKILKIPADLGPILAIHHITTYNIIM